MHVTPHHIILSLSPPYTVHDLHSQIKTKYPKKNIRSLYKLCISLLIQKIYTNIIVIKLKQGKEMYRTSDSSFPLISDVRLS